MSIYLRWGGAALVMIAALFASREYSAYAQRRISQYKGFVALISHAEGMIAKFLAKGEELWRGFTDNALEECGFISSLREGKSLSESFSSCEDRLCLPRGVREELRGFFSEFGKSYKDGQLSSLSLFRAKLETKLNEEEAGLEKSLKVTRALIIGGALSVVILII